MPDLISRYDARQQGLKRYYTGETCPHGHDSERYVHNTICVACAQIKFKRGNLDRVKAGTAPRKPNGKFIAWNPSAEERDAIRLLVRNGIPEPVICRLLGVSEGVLHRRCGHDLSTAAAEANSAVANSLFHMATEGPFQSRLPAAIFWLKVRAGWKEVEYVEMLRPPSEMTDDELETAIALAKQGTSKKTARRAKGRVVDFAAFRSGTSK
jgi:hypothetical protein